MPLLLIPSSPVAAGLGSLSTSEGSAPLHPTSPRTPEEREGKAAQGARHPRPSDHAPAATCTSPVPSPDPEARAPPCVPFFLQSNKTCVWTAGPSAPERPSGVRQGLTASLGAGCRELLPPPVLRLLGSHASRSVPVGLLPLSHSCHGSPALPPPLNGAKVPVPGRAVSTAPRELELWAEQGPRTRVPAVGPGRSTVKTPSRHGRPEAPRGQQKRSADKEPRTGLRAAASALTAGARPLLHRSGGEFRGACGRAPSLLRVLLLPPCPQIP